MTDLNKTPRLFVPQPLSQGENISLKNAQTHYLQNVMRLSAGDPFRLFNGKDGEWLCEITKLDKKTAEILAKERIKDQSVTKSRVHLLFAPLKKNRMDFLIEKAVELGVTDLHPVLTAHGAVRKINTGRLEAQIIEAAEQCERLSLAELHKLQKLPAALQSWDSSVPLYAALERRDAPFPGDVLKPGDAGFLIGPEGGFAPNEIELIQKLPFTVPISLGSQILRSETAALACLSVPALNMAS